MKQNNTSDSTENSGYNWCWLGFHSWNKWKPSFAGSIYQRRDCKICGFIKEKSIGWF